MDLNSLSSMIEGEVFEDDETLQEMQMDFGRIVTKKPGLVVLPWDARDVQKVLSAASEEGFSVSTRGSGHSQSGQGLSDGGVLLDMNGLSRIGDFDEDSVWVESGVSWSDLVNASYWKGLVPRVLTNNLNVTVGGTLSMAGLGVSSHRYGTQADNVGALEVVTGEGHLVRCSADENRELFDCSRCGLGQFSVITRAKILLRKAAHRVRTYYLLYDSMDTLMDDQERMIREDRFHYIESWATPCVQGLRRIGDLRLPFAEWFFPMQLTVEFDEPPNEEELLHGLRFYRRVHTEDMTLLEYARRLEPVFDLWKQAGTWNLPHPWMEGVLPWSTAGRYITGILKDFPPNLLVGGHVLLWPCRGTTSNAPLFVHPAGELVMGFGILPAVPRHSLPAVLPLLKKASDLCMQVGGKRYLSGFVDLEPSQWRDHFGEMWPKLSEWKRFYDPKGILNPGFIPFHTDDAATS